MATTTWSASITPIGRLDHESSVLFRQGSNATVELDRKIEGGRVLLQIGDHFVAGRIAIRVTGKVKPGRLS